MISRGSRYDGIALKSIPPGSPSISNTVERYPRSERKCAAVSPAGPDPTIATRVSPSRAGPVRTGLYVDGSIRSVMNRFNARIASAWPP